MLSLFFAIMVNELTFLVFNKKSVFEEN